MLARASLARRAYPSSVLTPLEAFSFLADEDNVRIVDVRTEVKNSVLWFVASESTILFFASKSALFLSRTRIGPLVLRKKISSFLFASESAFVFLQANGVEAVNKMPGSECPSKEKKKTRDENGTQRVPLPKRGRDENGTQWVPLPKRGRDENGMQWVPLPKGGPVGVAGQLDGRANAQSPRSVPRILSQI
jgi:hypothetical protein